MAGHEEQGRRMMNIRKQLGRVAGVAAAAVVIGGVGLSGVASAAPAVSRFNGPVYGCVFETVNGHYLTAVGGRGRTTDVIHTDATRIGSWEKFTLIDSRSGSAPIQYGFETANGHYLTAVGGGGRITDVIHSDATQLQAWERPGWAPERSSRSLAVIELASSRQGGLTMPATGHRE
jgi:hypothetical protein